VRQRNDTGHVVDVAAYPTDKHPEDRPFSVGPGEAKDFHDLIGGFTPIEDQPEPEPAPKTTTRKRAEPAPAPEGDDR
jgi:hypothetical protein